MYKNIEKDIDVVSIDSIFEFQAMEKEKDIVNKLITYIIESISINRKIRFIIATRPTNEVEYFVEKLSIDEVQTIQINPVPSGKTFEDIIQNDITVILGEPASGKTSQLKEYKKEHKKSLFVPLVTLKDADTISNNINVVLIDSIDEALHQGNIKSFAEKFRRIYSAM